MGTTRRDIRVSVARMLSDYYSATDSVGGETGMFTDRLGLAGENGKYLGMQIHFSNPASANYGHIAVVTQSDGAERRIYFEPPLTDPVEAGDTIDMYNHRSRGTTMEQYNGAINDAISAARQQHYVVPVAFPVVDLFSRTATEIDIPEDFVSFTSMEATKHDGSKYRVRPGDLLVDRFARTVTVKTPSAVQFLHGLPIVLRGYTMPDLLTSDDDETDIDLEWLYNEVKAQVLERMVASGMPVNMNDRLFLQERQEAIGKRGLIVNRALPNTIRLL